MNTIASCAMRALNTHAFIHMSGKLSLCQRTMKVRSSTPHNQIFTNADLNYLDDQLEFPTPENIGDIIDDIKFDLENGEPFRTGIERNQ